MSDALIETKKQLLNELPQAFEKALRSGAVSHAVLLDGGSEESRRAVANLICAAWLCEGEAPPCMVCRHCRKALGAVHPDSTYLREEEGKQISVDSVRHLLSQSIVKPSEASRRVFIIENAHKLNPQGQNALLKSIEEPAPSACFLLLCRDRNEMLSTIRSRVTAYSLAEEAEHFSDEASLAARNMAAALANASEWELLTATAPLEKNKPLMAGAFRILLSLLRRALLLNNAAAEGDDASVKIVADLAALSSERLVQLIENVFSLERDLTHNANLSLLRCRIPALMFS